VQHRTITARLPATVKPIQISASDPSRWGDLASLLIDAAPRCRTAAHRALHGDGSRGL